MNWFGRENPLRSSSGQKKSYRFSPFQKINEGTCLEVFKSHWQQAWSIMAKYEGGYKANLPLVDDISSVVNLLDQMTTLLLREAQQSDDGDSVVIGPILSFFLSEECLDKVLRWSFHTGEFINVLKLEQLKLFEVLVSHCHQDLLFHKPVVRPLLCLLSSCRECCPVEVEKRLVILLNALCVYITQFPDLLQVFFHASSDQGEKRSESSTEMFLIFSLLIPFVHREGSIGQQARDALLLCMSLSRKNRSIGTYIAEHSNFCPILATGLSGLYSVLPRKVSVFSEDWHRFTSDDISHMPELSMFLNSLEFCNAVIQVAHPMVQDQLLEYLYQGFLIPVLGPALHQNTLEEVIATTAYLELFLRTVTEPILLQVFLKFLLTSSHDGHYILNTLVDRLGAQGQLCLVTMALFHRLLDINCEDVLFQLVFRFLIPCSHIMVSQRSRIRDIDIYGSSAEKFLSLIPNCCLQNNKVDSSHSYSNRQLLGDIPFMNRMSSSRGGSLRIKSHHRSPSTSSFSLGDYDKNRTPLNDFTPEVFHSSYLDYLRSMHECVKSCTLACLCWSAPYDGCEPPPEFPFRQIIDQSSKNEIVHNGFSHALCTTSVKCNSKMEEKPLMFETCTSSLKLCNETSLTTDNVETCSNQQQSFSLPDDHSKITDVSKVDCNKDIFGQLVQTEDENVFWSLISSTKTPSSVSDLDDSLDTADINVKENEVVKSSKSFLNHSSMKEEGCNMDSGVFESRDSNSSSDRDNDSEVGILSCAKSKNINGSSLLKKVAACRTSSTYSPSLEIFSHIPNVGPFMSILLTRLEMMMQNDVYTNLHLTGLISRLACYPQPLLRSFLLNHSLVFQPTVRSLLQVLGSLKHKVDSYSCTVDNFDELVLKGRQFLIARENCFMHSNEKNVLLRNMHNAKPDISSELQRGEPRRRSLSNLLFKRSNFFRAKSQMLNKDQSLGTISDNQDFMFVTKSTLDVLEGEMESVKTKNAVLCAIVLEEFLKEVAAIIQEHSIIQLDPDFWDSKWQLTL